MLIRDPIALERYSASCRVWQGIPGIARTRGGRTFICFYSGDVKEMYGNYAVVLKSDDGKNFGEPILQKIPSNKIKKHRTLSCRKACGLR